MGNPIFVLGMARTGTTLVQRILNSVEGVTIAGEHFGALRSLSSAYFGMLEEQLLSSGTAAEVRARLHDPTRAPNWTNYFSLDRLRDDIRHFVEALCRDPERRDDHWGFKETRYLTYHREVDLLALLYPEARFVCVVRNSVPVVVSNRVMFDIPDIASLAEVWAKKYANVVSYLEKYPERVFLIRYEEMIDRESAALERLLGWLGFGCTERQRALVTMSAGRQSRTARTALTDEELLTADEISQVRRITAEVRERLRYP